MQVLNLEAAATMSSRQIAELCEKHHHHVISTITYLRKEGCLDGRETPYTHPQNGQKYVEWLFDRDNSIVLVARLEPKFMKAIIDRWQELEAQQAPKIPKTYAAALLEAGRLAEIVENQSLTIENQAHRLDEAKKWASVKRMETSYGLTFKFSELKKYSLKHGYDMPKVRDANYAAGVNTYHEDVWMAVYQVDIPE